MIVFWCHIGSWLFFSAQTVQNAHRIWHLIWSGKPSVYNKQNLRACIPCTSIIWAPLLWEVRQPVGKHDFIAQASHSRFMKIWKMLACTLSPRLLVPSLQCVLGKCTNKAAGKASSHHIIIPWAFLSRAGACMSKLGLRKPTNPQDHSFQDVYLQCSGGTSPQICRNSHWSQAHC